MGKKSIKPSHSGDRSSQASASTSRLASAGITNNQRSHNNKRSYMMMYFSCVLALLVVCLAVYSRAMALSSPTSSSSSSSFTSSREICGNKDIWRASTTKSNGGDDAVSMVPGEKPSKPAVWGSLRPGVYFGMKTKSEPAFLSTGIMWSEGATQVSRNFRHSVHTDEIDHFEWLRNNGRTFGIEQLRDTKAQLVFNATFLIESNTTDGSNQDEVKWHQHFVIKRPAVRQSAEPTQMSFIHYFGMDCDASDDQPLCFTLGRDIRDIDVHISSTSDESSGLDTTGYVVKVTGFSSLSGWFSLRYRATPIGHHDSSSPLAVSFYAPKGKQKKAGSGLPMMLDKVHRAKDLLRKKTKTKNRSPSSDDGILFSDEDGAMPNIVEKNAVGVFVQFLSASPMDIHVEFESDLSWNSVDDVQVEHTPVEVVSSACQLLTDDFDRQFASKFFLDENVFTSKQIETARRGLSNLLGGLGYFHGSPVTGDSIDYVPSANRNVSKVPSNTLTLFSGTPSRSSFPRGFLWDEGFHQMLMSNWDPYLTIEVLTSWMGCMMRAEISDDDNSAVAGECRGGWIPRELILGQEAFKVVPSEFVTQRVDIANPPTLLIVVEKLVEKWQQGRRNAKQCDNVNAKVGGEGYCDLNADFDKFHGEIVSFLKDSYFSLHDWVQWFIDSQSAGDVSTSPATAFRWRGRSEDSSRLAPNTLASGLDDYPRSQYPSSDEQHVDLLSWVAMSCRVMQKVGTAIVEAAASSDFDGHESFVAEVDRVNQEFYSDEIFAKFMDNLISVHWSDADKTFYDIGLVGDNERIDEGVTVRCTDDKRGGGTADVLVEIERLQNSRGREPSLCPTDFPRYLYPLGDGNGGLRMGNIFSSSPSRVVGFVPRVGYVNIFPFILKLLPSDSPQLEHMLDLVSFSKGLGSVHGLRSLSKKDLFYQRENAPGDAPYWRGPIWMPINYLALGALKHYSLMEDCPQAKRAEKIYNKLRRNLLKTVLTEYDRSGYFWEIYDDSSGKGMRGHPFSGWTTLIVNIMAELY